MKTKKWFLSSAICMVLLGAVVEDASAAQTLRVQVNQKGDFLLIGNTLGHECAAGTPAPVVGTVGQCGTNTSDTAPDIFWRSEQPGPGQALADTGITLGQSRSTAMLNIPAGATVTHAFLYWGANLPNGDPSITLDRPGGFSQNLTAQQIYTSVNDSYQSVVDITSIVQAQGTGTYRVSGVDGVNVVNLNSSNNYAGWWMAVFYQLASEPPRNLALFDGLDNVGSGNPQNLTLSGFLVPPGFTSAKLGLVAFEGDNTLTGDSFSFGPAPALTDAMNPATNFFNGSHSFFGNPVSNVGDLPQLSGAPQSMSGVDIDVVDVTTKLVPGQSSVPISATSAGDVYYLAGFVTSIPTFKPDFSSSQKTALDVDGGALLPSDVIEYSILASNNGNDTSANTVVVDDLPLGVTYLANSISIVTGPNAGPVTDAAGDDQCEYIAATRTVKCRIGVGANATNGGEIAVGGSSMVKFRVTVDANASGTIYNQATITASGLLGAPADDTPTDGNGVSNGQPPTPIIIEACNTDAQCSMPTPYCKVVSGPNQCVQCLTNSHCPATASTCDLNTNMCTCVASGPEVCDNVDNDCDGSVDEGLGVGQACSVGIGACAATGALICNAQGGTSCSATAGSPSSEVCDKVDNDCDGSVDEGLGIGQACSVGIGACAATGALICNAQGGTSCSATAGSPSAEVCDNVDNDCDGSVDDGLGIGQACSVGIGACAATGALICNAQGGTSCSATAGSPSAEVCDNVDNDCDGSVDEGCGDSDGDGLSDIQESQLGTDPFDADSDDDGVADGKEMDLDKDTDGDGVINALDPDSDNDGLFDGTEMGLGCSGADTDVAAGHCIADADQGATKTSPIDPDTDDGGIKDGAEDANHNGTVDAGETNPIAGKGGDDEIDSDGDGLSDPYEVQIGSDPQDADSDDDGVADGEEMELDKDTDGDGVINALDPDSDNDGLFDGTEMGLGCSGADTDAAAGHCIADADEGATKTSPIDPDTDDGGIKDGAEDANHNGTVDAGETNPIAGKGGDDEIDSDGDGLSDPYEVQIGSDPQDADSDDDGVADGEEMELDKDTDGDGVINAQDPDSDNDGLFDGTEMGLGCSGADTDAAAGHCIADADEGATKTSPIDPDTDDGGIKDGVEDANHNGMVDAGEMDPNAAIDDGSSVAECSKDAECSAVGTVCDDRGQCVEGCRGQGGNGCPDGFACSSVSDAVGVCQEGTILSGNGLLCTVSREQTDGSAAFWSLAALAALIMRRKRS